ncbi:MAG: hypothetical protein ACPG6B_09185 [Oceanihabitans sp.]
MKKLIICLLALTAVSITKAQNNNCKVINKELKGLYKGDCKSGLAHGIGAFTFEKGMFVYEGEFIDGKMHGKGKIYSLVSNNKKLISEGVWDKNIYVENDKSKPYDVKRTVNLERNSVKKVNEGKRILINFLRNGTRNNVRNLNINLSSGNPSSGSTYYIYENVEFPLSCEITYTTANKINRSSFNVRYEVVINEPGEWEISLYN